MKLSFAIGLISLIVAGISADKVSVPLMPSTVGDVIQATNAHRDPTLCCQFDYTLGLVCTNTTTGTGPCTIGVANFVVNNCTIS